MNCHAARAVFDLHAEGRLSPRRAADVAAHLAGCPACRRQAQRSPAPAPTRADAALKARLAAALRAGRTRGRQAAPDRAIGEEVPPLHAVGSAADPGLPLWPRELSGVAAAVLGLALLALLAGWSGVPSQRFEDGPFSIGRLP